MYAPPLLLCWPLFREHSGSIPGPELQATSRLCSLLSRLVAGRLRLLHPCLLCISHCDRFQSRAQRGHRSAVSHPRFSSAGGTAFWLDGRPLRASSHSDLQYPLLLGAGAGLRLHALAARPAHPARSLRHCHGWGVGRGRGPGLRDAAQGEPRLLLRATAGRLCGRLPRRRCCLWSVSSSS